MRDDFFLSCPLSFLEEKNGIPVIFLFSGQGSHYYAMGQELYATNWRFRHWMNLLDDIAMNFGSGSILQELYSSTPVSARFDNLRITHPAIFMIQYALAKTLMEDGIKPDILVGSSLGEIIAAAIAETMRLEDAVLLVLRQAYFFYERAGDGGMMAVLAQKDVYEVTPQINRNLSLAADNFDGHFVVSGPDAAIREVAEYLSGQKISQHILDVPVAFHSHWIDPLETEWLLQVNGLSLARAKIPILSPARCILTHELQVQHFWDCVRRPIQFSRICKGLLNMHRKFIYIDISPTATAAGFLGNLGVDKRFLIPAMNMYGKNVKTYKDAFERYYKLQEEHGNFSFTSTFL